MGQNALPELLIHPDAALPLPRLDSAAQVADLLCRAEVISVLEPRSGGGDRQHPASRLMSYCEQIRLELPLDEQRCIEVAAELDPLLRDLARAGYFAFGRILTRRMPRAGAVDHITGVLTLAAAHPDYPVDGTIRWA